MTDIEKTIEEAKASMLPFESWERLEGESPAAFAAFCVGLTSFNDGGSLPPQLQHVPCHLVGFSVLDVSTMLLLADVDYVHG